MIVTAFFAPQRHSAMFRVHKLAKLLPDLGWTVDVLTTQQNYQYHEDPALLGELPSSVTIYRADHTEISLRGVRAWAAASVGLKRQGPEATTFAPSTERSVHSQLEKLPTAGDLPQQRSPFARSIARAKRWVDPALSALRSVPDGHWPWIWPATALGKTLSRPDVILSSAPPYSVHQVASSLARHFETPWVCDLRDPETYNNRDGTKPWWARPLQTRIEFNAVQSATRVTVAARGIGMILRDIHGLDLDNRLTFIPTGLDTSILPGPRAHPRGGQPYIVFPGEYLAQYGDGFLRTYAQCVHEMETQGRTVPDLLFVGPIRENQQRVGPYIEALGLQDHVQILEQLSQGDLYTLLDHALAGVLISTPWLQWWCLYAKLVDFLALEKPVLALVPPTSEARTHLEEAGLGVFVDGPEGAGAMLRFFCDGWNPEGVNQAYCHTFTARKQAADFSSTLQEAAVHHTTSTQEP